MSGQPLVYGLGGRIVLEEDKSETDRFIKTGRDLVELECLKEPRYFLGLDLGQSQDYTALAVVERHGAGDRASFT
jgi:hypothetical protein